MISQDMGKIKGDAHSTYQTVFQKVLEERFNPNEEYLGREKPVNRIDPLVSVYVATYQHAPFIRQCLDRILMQKTSFPFEILLGEDESSDGTREICKEYAENYPDRIRLFLRDRNTSQYLEPETGKTYRFNVKWLRKSSRGKYAAVCEGDDYWTDPKKLEKQVEFLEANEDYILTVGGYKVLDVNTGNIEQVIKRVNENDNGRSNGYIITLEEASRAWITKSLTLMYRNIKKVNPKLYQYSYSRDVHFIYHLLQEGKGFYFTEVFGVYRQHDGGVFSSLSLYQKKMVNYRVNKEIFDVNRDEISRKMHMASVKSLLRLPQYRLTDKEISKSKIQLLFEGLRTAKSFKEHLSVIKTAVIRK